MKFPRFLISPSYAWARSRLERAHVVTRWEWEIEEW